MVTFSDNVWQTVYSGCYGNKYLESRSIAEQKYFHTSCICHWMALMLVTVNWNKNSNLTPGNYSHIIIIAPKIRLKNLSTFKRVNHCVFLLVHLKLQILDWMKINVQYWYYILGGHCGMSQLTDPLARVTIVTGTEIRGQKGGEVSEHMGYLHIRILIRSLHHSIQLSFQC